MNNEFATHAQDQDMLLSLEDTPVSIDVDMLETGEIDEPLHPSPVMNKVEDEIAKPFLLALRTFMDVESAVSTSEEVQTVTLSLYNDQFMEQYPKVLKPSKARGSYRRYTTGQIEKLFDLVIEEGNTAKEAALITGVNIRTAQHYVKRNNDNIEIRLPISTAVARFGHKKQANRNPFSISNRLH